MASQKRRGTISSSNQQQLSSSVPKTPSPSNSTSKRRKLEVFRSPSEDSRTSIANMYNFGATRSAPIDSPDSKQPNARGRRISNAGPLSMSSAPNGQGFGTKKLVVKGLKPANRSKPNEYIINTISQLDAALVALFKDEKPVQSNEELYKGAENLCKLGNAPELAKLMDKRCKEHIGGTIRPKLAQKATEANADVLTAVVGAWKVLHRQTISIRSILYFLDRTYLLQSSKTSIMEMGVKIFRSQIFGDTVLAEKTMDGACDLVLADRKQESPNKALFQDAVDMFHALAIYTDRFEPKLLATSQAYIANWADTECAERELPDYVSQCNHFLQSEMGRCDGFNLDDTTRRELLQLLEHHLIDRKEADLTDRDSVADLLDNDDLISLEALFTLLQRRRLGMKLRTPFAQWIDDTGTAIVFDEKGQDQMVVKLLELKVKLDKTWRHAFQKERDLSHTVRESFEAFINKSKKTSATWNTDNSKPGEMIAKYVDQLLRSGAKAIPHHLSSSTVKATSLAKPGETIADAAENNEDFEPADDDDNAARDEDAEVDSQLDQVLDLFRFVHGKAVFEAFYKKDLARRLLMGRSASNEAEKSMLNRLKAECGNSFTHNLETMFRDVDLARDEMSGFKERAATQDAKPNLDLNVNILSQSAWPTYPDIPVIIPEDVSRAIKDFENYHCTKHTGRKLSWKHALAHCQLRAKFPRGNKEVIVSSFQAIVLLLFNGVSKDEHVPYSRILAESGLPEAEVKRTLQSLACAKLRPLTKHPKGRDVNDTDTFTVNLDFHHERYRVKINAIQLKETAEENKETHERVAADRQYETQAAIVRIMKSRKTITHQELVAETIKATKTRGVLQPQDIKRNIDKLIDKEYMEQLESGKYGYLA